MKKRKAREVWLHDWPNVCLNHRGDGTFITKFCYYCNNLEQGEPKRFREVLPRRKKAKP